MHVCVVHLELQLMNEGAGVGKGHRRYDPIISVIYRQCCYETINKLKWENSAGSCVFRNDKSKEIRGKIVQEGGVEYSLCYKSLLQ